MPIRVPDGLARLSEKEARGVSGRAVRKLFLPRLLAVHVLIVWHVMLKNGVSGCILRHARCGIDGHLAVQHAEVLAPDAGRLSLSGKVRLPIAHDLRCDTTLQRQAVASYDFLFRKEMLPCEHVKWRKRKMSGRTHLVIGIIGVGNGCISGDKRGCHPGGVVVKALTLT